MTGEHLGVMRTEEESTSCLPAWREGILELGLEVYTGVHQGWERADGTDSEYEVPPGHSFTHTFNKVFLRPPF